MNSDAFNRDCRCATLDPAALDAALSDTLGAPGLERLARRNPHVFAPQPVFVAPADAARMAAVVAAVERLAVLPGWIDAALALGPAAARRDPGNPGAFLGFDFHIESQGPRLIEINTNPGGALLSAALARAQRACCDDTAAALPSGAAVDAFEADVLAMFLREWTDAGRAGRPRTIAIVDDAPQDQYLWAEFVLYARLFEAAGIRALIADPRDLHCADAQLWLGDEPVDMVYNRLTDFALEQPAHAALRQAWDTAAAVLTPHPRQHALLADKRLLSWLCDVDRLRGFGLDAADAELIAAHVPCTVLVDANNADRLWARRRELFFKPWSGFGSRAAYRGAGLTRRVWEEIRAGQYVAQELAPPGERAGTDDATLKFDVRAWVERGRLLWLSARLYQGQTTNFRTAGGGLATVYAAAPPAAAAQPRPTP